MYPRGSKDGYDPSRPPRAPSTTQTEREETHEQDLDESSQSRGEEGLEDGHENHLTSASGSLSTLDQSNSGARASPSNTTTAPGIFLRYRRHGDSSSTGQISVAPQGQAQPSTRPHDPQTPPRNTSRGPEGDFHAGHIPRYHTQPGYHRQLTNARENHAENPSEENSAAIARARSAGTPFDRRPPPPQTIPPDRFGLALPPRPHVPGLMRPLQSPPTSNGHGSSMPAIDRFHREAAQLAFEQQNRRQQTTPPPDMPRPVPRPRVHHPAHNRPLDQSSTSRQPGQASAQAPQDPTRPTKSPPHRQPEDDEDQNGGI